jgi:hypothetical protein
MPDLYGPFDGATWQQSQWYRDAYARELSGVAGEVFTAPGAGDLALTVSGLTVSMGLGRAHVRGAGYERTGTAWTYNTPPNTAAQPRVDRLVLRRDLAARTVTPLVLQGTPAASPAAPAVSQVEDGAWDLSLYSYTVPANSGAPLTNIVDERVPGDLGALRRNRAWSAPPEATLFTNIASGWALSAAFLRRVGPGMCYLDSTWTKTGSALAVPASGDIANVTIATLIAPYRPPATVPTALHSTGRMVSGGLRADGTLVLVAVAPSGDIAVNETIQMCAGFYPLASDNVAPF